MVNTRTDAVLSTAVQSALQTLLPQIRAEIHEEFRTSSRPSDAGGDAWLITVTWAEFKKLFFLQFFPRSEQEPGFLGAAAGTEEEQAKNFQWDLRSRHPLIIMILISRYDNKNSGNGRDQINMGQQSNRSVNSGNSS
nr:hypothetical protein [Tanacetum cinerariifolium]